ncbi:excalibur calcium-binding protein [Streptomyces sp. NPDC000229]|uniref:excalibur calcium-binding protein n=1 Tax=Streptomyces sp. NPDC000229 TaxID=3154247 RepID=UPI003332B6E3
MKSRSAAAGALIAIASIVPLSGIAHAQDLDCRDFVYQEDAQAVFNSDPRDPHRLDEDQGPDDGIACEVLPRRGAAVAPRSVSPTPPVATPTPTRGVRGGLGGSSAAGSADWQTGVGLTFTVGAALAGGYVLLRRRHG